MTRPVRILTAAVVALAGLAFAWGLAGTIGGMIPVNRGWRPPAQGVTIWIEDNGIHTGLVVPKLAAGVDWRDDFPAADLRDPRYGAYGHLAIGWGERGFYLGTPRWRDLRVATILHAAVGSDETLLHVEHVAPPGAGPDVRAIVLRPDEYRRLSAAIRASRGHGAKIAGYGAWDAFYPGKGRYDAVHTCNDWTGRTLAAAGVRVGAWTPWPATIMHWF